MLFELADRLDEPIGAVSRSDSTLRGHVIAEVRALDAARREVTGRGFDGVLLAPAYFEAGRSTAGDVHWARVGTDVLPVSEDRVRPRRHLRLRRLRPARLRRLQERRGGPAG
jgi:uncharacterized protein YgbK (DUF1537 family)